MDETTNATPPTTKWTPTTIGPRQLKPLQTAMNNLRHLSQSFRERTGYRGEPETQKVSEGWMWSPCSPAVWDEPHKAHLAIGQQFGWTLTKENAVAVTAAYQDAYKKLLPDIPVKDSLRDRAAEDTQKVAMQAKQEAARKAKEERIAAAQAEDGAVYMSIAEILAQKPAWATAAIVAEEDVNTSDSMTDYHGHDTIRTVLIGWRRGPRDDFAQYRRAAATFMRTAHLGPGCENVKVRLYHEPFVDANTFRSSLLWTDERGRTREFSTEAQATAAIEAAFAQVRAERERPMADRPHVPHDLAWDAGYSVEVEHVEHREKWSMGAGYYLKAGHSNSNGWGVSATSIPRGEGRMEVHLPAAVAGGPAPATGGATDRPTVGGEGEVSVSHNTEHDGIEITFPAKPDESVRSTLKARGFRWSMRSGCWYKKNGPGLLEWAQQLAMQLNMGVPEAAGV